MQDKDELLKFTIPQLLRWRVKETGDKVAMREKDFGYWVNYTWNYYYELVRKVALGLEKVGVKKGDKVALIGDNIPELLFRNDESYVYAARIAEVMKKIEPDLKSEQSRISGGTSSVEDDDRG